MSTTLASQNLAQVDKEVLKAFQTGARGYISRFQDVFIVETPERVNEEYVIVQTDSSVQEVTDGAAFPTQNVKEVGQNTITQKIFKSAIEIGDLSSLFDNYGQIVNTAQTRGYHFKAKMDTLAADFFNNATSTSSPYGFTIGGSTTALSANSQPIGDTGDTQDNRIAGPLDKDTFDEAIQALMTQKDHDGMIAHYQPRRLVVPVQERMNAWQLAYSPMEPASANNNRNYLNTLGIEIIPWVQLTSSTACFLMADKSDIGAKGPRLLVKQMPQVKRVLNTTTGNFQYQIRMVMNPGVVDYQGIVTVGL